MQFAYNILYALCYTFILHYLMGTKVISIICTCMRRRPGLGTRLWYVHRPYSMQYNSGLKPAMLASSVKAVVATVPRVCPLVLFIFLVVMYLYNTISFEAHTCTTHIFLYPLLPSVSSFLPPSLSLFLPLATTSLSSSLLSAFPLSISSLLSPSIHPRLG